MRKIYKINNASSSVHIEDDVSNNTIATISFKTGASSNFQRKNERDKEKLNA